MGGNWRVAFFFLNYLDTPGSVSCKKVVPSRELEAKSLFGGDLKRKGSKGKSSSGSISFCHSTLGLNWRGLAFVQSTLDAKRDGIWKHTKRERWNSFVPHGHYLYRQRVISISKYSGLSSSSYYRTFISPPPFLLTSELGNGKTPGAGTSWKEISISFVVWLTGL